MARLILAYQRVRDAYNGRLLHTEMMNPLCTFMQSSFAQLIEETALALKRHSEVTSVAFERTERAAIPIYVLTEEELTELREDHKAFADRRSPPPTRIIVKNEPIALAPKFVVRAGYDTLADAFGDDVYIRRVESKLECPCCGRWAEQHALTSLLCNCMMLALPVTQLMDRWAVIPLEHLFYQNKDRYYLPRAWNIYGPWISRRELTQKFLDYVNEKEKAHDGR